MIEGLKEKFQKACVDGGVTPSVVRTQRGEMHSIKKGKTKLEVTLSDNWMGYSLVANQSDGKLILEISEDTDNYELGGKNIDVTKSIFEHALACLKGIINESILVGADRGKSYMAVPLQEADYILLTKGRIFTKFGTCSSDQINKMHFMKNLDYTN